MGIKSKHRTRKCTKYKRRFDCSEMLQLKDSQLIFLRAWKRERQRKIIMHGIVLCLLLELQDLNAEWGQSLRKTSGYMFYFSR